MPDEHTPSGFIDTNIWLYAFIRADDPGKSAIASKLIVDVEPVISTQIINEVCVNLLRKTVFSEDQIAQLIEAFYGKYRVVELALSALLEASRLRKAYSLSFWDSTYCFDCAQQRRVALELGRYAGWDGIRGAT